MTSFIYEQEWKGGRAFDTDVTVTLRIEHNIPGTDEMARIGELVAAVERYLNPEGPTA